MRLIKVPLTIGSYSGGIVKLTWTPEEHARVAMIGLSVDKRSALWDHQLRGIKHRGDQHVTPGEAADGSVMYPHLGSAACFVDYMVPETSGHTPVVALTDDITGDAADDTLADIPDPADTPASADALRDDFTANIMPIIRQNMIDMAAKTGEVIDAQDDLADAVDSLIQTLTREAEFARRGFQPWPGRFNDPADWQALLMKLANRVPLTQHETIRLKMARQVPCERFTMIPLKPNAKLEIEVERIHGTTRIAYAYAWCIAFDDVTDWELVCSPNGRDLTDLPHWLCTAMELTAASGVQTDVEKQWVAEALGDHALRVVSLFATAHSNDNDATIDYAPDYLADLLLKVKAGGGADVFPTYASKRVRISEHVPQFLQQFDCWRRFDYVLRYLESLLFETQALTTKSYQRDVRLVVYGLLRPQEDGRVPDAA